MFLLIQTSTQYPLCRARCFLPERVSTNRSKLSYAIPTVNEESGTRSGGEIFEADVTVNVSSISSSFVIVQLTQCPYLLNIPINILFPVMVLTASPSFKCIEVFFLPFVTKNTVSAAKDSTLFILLDDS